VPIVLVSSLLTGIEERSTPVRPSSAMLVVHRHHDTHRGDRSTGHGLTPASETSWRFLVATSTLISPLESCVGSVLSRYRPVMCEQPGHNLKVRWEHRSPADAARRPTYAADPPAPGSDLGHRTAHVAVPHCRPLEQLPAPGLPD
jgi:hypothetical protein